MKKAIVVFLALILAGPFALRADPKDDLKGKVVRISGSVSGLGVVVLYKIGDCLILENVDGLQRQAFDLKNQDFRLEIMADSRDAYLQLQRDSLTFLHASAADTSASAVSAFLYLSEIAENARKWRTGAAIPSLIAGGILSTMGIYAWALGDNQDDDLSQITLASGLIVSGVGVFHLSLKSSAERSYNQALKLSAEERNAFCAAALKKESSQAKVGRFISAGIYFGLAAAVLQQTSAIGYEPEEYARFIIPHVIALGITALYKLVFPSFEEKMYRRYLEEKAIVEQSNKLTLNVGLVPRGFSLGVNYFF